MTNGINNIKFSISVCQIYKKCQQRGNNWEWEAFSSHSVLLKNSYGALPRILEEPLCIGLHDSNYSVVQ